MKQESNIGFTKDGYAYVVVCKSEHAKLRGKDFYFESFYIGDGKYGIYIKFSDHRDIG